MYDGKLKLPKERKKGTLKEGKNRWKEIRRKAKEGNTKTRTKFGKTEGNEGK
jgi:hypothetical protein